VIIFSGRAESSSPPIHHARNASNKNFPFKLIAGSDDFKDSQEKIIPVIKIVASMNKRYPRINVLYSISICTSALSAANIPINDGSIMRSVKKMISNMIPIIKYTIRSNFFFSG